MFAAAKASVGPSRRHMSLPYSSSTSTVSAPSSASNSTARPRSPGRSTANPPRRRLAPGLEERLKRLGQRKTSDDDRRAQQHIGRIPDEQIQELERLQRQQQEKEIARRGKVWAGRPATAMPRSGGVLLSGGPVITDNELSVVESDVSSIIDISDHFGPSETDDDHDALHDTNKYRLPHTGKTRLDVLTKEPLSPAAQAHAPRLSSPTTPRTTRPNTATAFSPGRMDFGFNWSNGSVESMSSVDGHGRSRMSRSGSIYTLGRASFTGQLSQLTSMRLPDATSLAKKISDMPSASDAAKALSDAFDQIRGWISKASDVLNGLNAEDDVEWAAAGGKEGISDVDGAISRFGGLVDVYIASIERLQTRADIAQLPAAELLVVVKQMETIVANWAKIKLTLQSVKDQVEIAMDWEELWNTTLGEAGQEMGNLNQLVFEMEEKRHEGAESLIGTKDFMNLEELETIVEEQPGRSTLRMKQPITPTSPQQTPADTREGSNLIALFARMEPLRASLDFLPMKLSAWGIRGQAVFPSAYQDLENRRDQLEKQWEKLSADADSLRRELGEDKWIQLFRNAGRKALKIWESISRSYDKLCEGLDAGEQHTNFPALFKKVESYEAKKLHYSPAIERVLAIIDRGVQDRLTVNGEILRLQSELRSRWTTLQKQMKELQPFLDELHSENREKQLRESVSTVVSSERSVGSSFVDTPGSSPASSVLGLSRKSSFQGSKTPTSVFNIKTRSSGGTTPAPRKALPRLSNSSNLSASPQPPSASKTAWPSRPDHTPGERPRWKSVVKSTDTRDFPPLSAFEPSPYARAPTTPKAGYLRSTSHPASLPPVPSITMSTTPMASSLPRPTPKTMPTRVSSQPLSTPTPSRTTPRVASSSNLRTQTSSGNLRPASRLTGFLGKRLSAASSNTAVDGNEADNESPAHQRRSPSALGVPRKFGVARPASRLNDVDTDHTKPKWRP